MRRTTRSILTAAAAVPLMLGVAVPSALADSEQANVGFGTLLYDGAHVRTVATPTSMPGRGVDDIYVVPNQLNVTSVAPGDRDYHGGRWAVNVVTWNSTPYLLDSEDDILTAATAGDITITRAPDNDFVCPVTGSAPGHTR